MAISLFDGKESCCFPWGNTFKHIHFFKTIWPQINAGAVIFRALVKYGALFPHSSLWGWDLQPQMCGDGEKRGGSTTRKVCVCVCLMDMKKQDFVCMCLCVTLYKVCVSFTIRMWEGLKHSWEAQTDVHMVHRYDRGKKPIELRSFSFCPEHQKYGSDWPVF